MRRIAREIGVAFGALLTDDFSRFDYRRRNFKFLPSYGLLVGAACLAVVLACWCWAGERSLRTPEIAPFAPSRPLDVSRQRTRGELRSR